MWLCIYLEEIGFPLAVAAGENSVNRRWDSPHVCDQPSRSRISFLVQCPKIMSCRGERNVIYLPCIFGCGIHSGSGC